MHVVRETILPILEEFEPEIIVNSAGQDNHYSDPITNMNFTAQGYARLNKNLNPDICVLEGGYSIEGALPYTNLGIVLAMAGMDTSHVREPDYDPARFRQSSDMNRYIESICTQAHQLFDDRHRLRQEYVSEEQVVERKRIFYDTTGFQVEETRVYRLCSECPGTTEVMAEGLHQHIHGFCIPFNACRTCQQKARDSFAATPAESQTLTVLQDRTAEIFEKK